MYIVSVLYPAKGRFDLDYYREKHLPLVERLLVSEGLSEMVYWQPTLEVPEAPFQVIAELRFPDTETASTALARHGKTTQDDIPNFTDVTPLILAGTLQS